MKLYRHILIKVLLPVIIAALAMAVISIVIISTNLNEWTSNIGSTLETAEIENLRNRMYSIQKLLKDQFNEINSDIIELEAYLTYILSNYKESSYYPSWSLITSVDPSVPPNANVSGYYETKGTSSYKVITSLLDDAFRFLYSSSTKYELLLLGLEDGLYRRFPFSRADSYPSMVYNCSATGQPVVGFTPTCRTWYTAAKTNPSSPICADPHSSATTGKSVITCGKAVFNNSQFIGVLGANIYMAGIDSLILAKVLDRGYTYIIDKNNVIIFYPNLNRENLYHLSDYEGITLTSFDGERSYSKNGESWLLVSQSITGTNYIVCISVPWSDIQRSKIQLDDESSSTMKVIFAVAATFICLITIVVIFISHKISLKIIKPLNDLSQFLVKLGKQDFKMNLVEPAEVPKEIHQVYNNFQDLMEALKFGNQAYYNGNWGLALENYEKIEKLMTNTQNKRGLGIVYSNKANTLRLVKGTSQATIVAEYEKAIDIAQTLIETNNKTKEYDEKTLTIDLADRFMNYGVYNMEIHNNDRSRKLLDDALNLYKTVDHSKGMAKTSGNIAQLLIQCNKFQEAEDLLSDLISYAQGPNLTEEISQRLLQYAYMNYGRLHKAKGQEDIAVTCFVKSLDSAKIWEKNVANICAQHIIEYHKKRGNNEQMSLLSDIFPDLGQTKHVKFVLDTSGSMMSIIGICRKSIVNIVERLNQEDMVSLYTFSTVVKPLFKDLPVGEKKNLIIDFVNNKTNNINGNTAFYDALFESLKNSSQSNDWIVALTDGEDNSSKLKANDLIENYNKFLNNIIIITVGQLKNANDILKLCEIARSHGKKGELLQVDNSNHDIADAFSKAGDIMLRGDVVQQDL